VNRAYALSIVGRQCGDCEHERAEGEA
jgi:hypothetical protein